MDRAGLCEEDAFLRIQHRARDANRKMADVARQIIDASDLLQ
jgi:AmiR/NasT family two-component response regulator